MRRLLLLLLSCACLLAPACTSAARYSDRTTLRIGWGHDASTLNPFMAVETNEYECFRLIYNLLIGFGKDLQPVPGLADHWRASADGLTWTYHLVRNATWHDGKPLTSADVKFTFDFVLHNEGMDLLLPYISAVKAVAAPDPYTVVLRLKEPSVLMEQIFIPILPRHIWNKINSKEVLTFEDRHPIGSGPFQLVDWRKSRYMRFTANKQYFRGRPHIDEVVFVAFANSNTMLQALRLGEVQAVTSIPPPLFRLLAKEPGVRTIVRPANGYTQLTLNTWASPKSKGNPALRDVRVRRALAFAIDRKRLLDLTKLGYGDIGTTIVPKMLTYWHWEPPAGQKIGYDPARARRLLNEAGYHLGSDGWLHDRQERVLRLRLLVRTSVSEELTAGQLIMEQLKEVGVAMDLRTVESATQDSMIKDNGDFDMALYAWGGDADPNFLLSLFTTSQIKHWNDYYYSNPEYDKLFARQQHLIDRKQRRAVLQKMQAIIYREAPTIVLYYDANLQGYRTDRFAGWRDDQVDGVVNTLGGLTYTSIHPLVTRP